MKNFMYFVPAILFVLNVIKADVVDDYFCRREVAKICERHGEKKHVACKHSKKFSESDWEMVNLSQDDINYFLKVLNGLRSEFAVGKNTKFSNIRAHDMVETVWSHRLMRYAELNILDIAGIGLKHDCCATEQYPQAGQNIAMAGRFTFKSLNDVIDFVHKEQWYDEYKLADVSDFRNFSMTSFSKGIGHCTQIMKRDLVAVGCAVAKQGVTYYVTCNYATGNTLNEPIIKFDEKKTTKPGCLCKVKSDKYAGLCAVGQEYHGVIGPYKKPIPEGPFHSYFKSTPKDTPEMEETMFAKTTEKKQEPAPHQPSSKESAKKQKHEPKGTNVPKDQKTQMPGEFPSKDDDGKCSTM